MILKSHYIWLITISYQPISTLSYHTITNNTNMEFSHILRFIFIALAFNCCAAIHNGWVAQDSEILRSFVHFGYFHGRNGENWVCGGVLITWKHVLTAAHCRVNPQSDVAFVGTSHLYDTSNTEGHVFEIEKVDTHPLFYEEMFLHDIAIVTLKEPSEALLRSKGIVPVDINWHVPQWEELPYQFRVMGLGNTLNSARRSSSSRLLYGDAYTTHPQQCADVLGSSADPTQTICFDGTYGSVTCTGDSGGPVVYWDNYRWVLVGLVSAGEPGPEHCIPGETWKATNVEHYRDWTGGVTGMTWE